MCFAGELSARGQREAPHRDAASVPHTLRRAPRVRRARILWRMLLFRYYFTVQLQILILLIDTRRVSASLLYR